MCIHVLTIYKCKTVNIYLYTAVSGCKLLTKRTKVLNYDEEKKGFMKLVPLLMVSIPNQPNIFGFALNLGAVTFCQMTFGQMTIGQKAKGRMGMRVGA